MDVDTRRASKEEPTTLLQVLGDGKHASSARTAQQAGTSQSVAATPVIASPACSSNHFVP
jgi:hypothetical protein